MTKRHPLADCEDCPLNTSEHKYVPSHGPDKAEFVFVGEAPGFKETITGKPFSGPSGRLLDAVLTEHGIDRGKVFVTNTVLCRPKRNETPSKRAISCCSVRLRAEIVAHEPDTIVALGATAASSIMDTPVKITQFRAGPPKESALYPGIKIVPTFHPAACLRNADWFPSMATDIGKANGRTASIQWEPPKYAEFDTASEGVKVLDELLNGYDKFVIDIETAFEKDAEFERPNHYPLLCLGIGYARGAVVVLGRNALASEAVRIKLKSLIEDKKLTGHNIKFDLSGLMGIGIGKADFDTMLASYALDERGGIHRLKYQSAEQLGCPDYESEIKKYTTGKNGSWANIPPDILHRYNAYDVGNTWDLEGLYKPQLTSELGKLNGFLIDASNFLMDVERGGMLIDQDLLGKLDEQYQETLEEQEKGLEHWVANPRSPKQVTEALAEYGIETDSTDADHLNLLLDEHLPEDSSAAEFCRRLLRYRKDQKLWGTYIQGLRKRLYNGRAFTTFTLHMTVTGRTSSRNMNLQNIPRGSLIKSMYVPAPGNVLIQGDYNQLEFRVVTCMAEEEAVAEIFRDPSRDVFGEFSERLFGKGWTKDHRQIMKRIVHGTDYGMEAKKMTEQINGDAKNFGVDLRVTVDDSKRFQKFYRGLVPGIMGWQNEVKNAIFKEGGDLVTDFGRHRRFWLITDENKYEVTHEGLAFKPQSIASDICLTAAMRLHKMMPEYGAAIRLLVHDSIIVEAPIEAQHQVAHLMQKTMMDAGSEWSDYVPFAVEIKISDQSWGAFG